MARAFGSLAWLATAIAVAVHIAPAAGHDPSSDGNHVASTDAGPDGGYLAENDAAMKKMMNDMAVTPTGDVDRDFVAMMIPHHQGAIDMAIAVLRYGSNEQLKRIAQGIIVEQQQEIAAMKLAIGDPLPLSAPVPAQIAPVTDDFPTPMSPAMPGMAANSKM